MKHKTRMVTACIASIALCGAAGCSGSANPDSARGTSARRLEDQSTCYTTIELGLGTAIAINQRGQVLVSGDTPADSPFVWEDGQRTAIGSLGGGGTEATALNDRGQVVGASRNAQQQTHAFLWTDGEMTDLGTLGGNSSRATDVDSEGRVVGDAQTASGDTHAFFWSCGEMTDLGTLGGTTSHAVAINAQGWIVGDARTASGETHAFLWKHGKMHDLGTLGGVSSTAVGINARGEIAGNSLTKDGNEHAFFWADDEMVDVGTLGGPSSHANAINQDGRIVGASTSPAYLTDPHGFQHAFVWDYDDGLTDLAPGDEGPRAFKSALDINEGGQIVVQAMKNPGTNTLWGSFVWDDGAITAIGNQPIRINDAGQIIGQLQVGHHEWKAALWNPCACSGQP